MLRADLMNKEWTTRRGRLLTLHNIGRLGYQPALAHLSDAHRVFIFATIINALRMINKDTPVRIAYAYHTLYTISQKWGAF